MQYLASLALPIQKLKQESETKVTNLWHYQEVQGFFIIDSYNNPSVCNLLPVWSYPGFLDPPQDNHFLHWLSHAICSCASNGQGPQEITLYIHFSLSLHGQRDIPGVHRQSFCYLANRGYASTTDNGCQNGMFCNKLGITVGLLNLVQTPWHPWYDLPLGHNGSEGQNMLWEICPMFLQNST